MQHRDPTKGRFAYTDPDAAVDDSTEGDWGQDESDFDPTLEPPQEQADEKKGSKSNGGEETDGDPSGEVTDGFDSTLDGTEGDIEEDKDLRETDKDRWIKLEKFLRAKDLEVQREEEEQREALLTDADRAQLASLELDDAAEESGYEVRHAILKLYA